MKDKHFRVIIWGRNKYDGHVQCNSRSYNSFNESEEFYLKNGMIHYVLNDPCVTWRAFKIMKHHYVFDMNGVCKSHQPKMYLTDRWDSRRGLPYAELTIS